MADQRQPFRFRLPWMATTPALAPAAARQPAPQRPPFRPAGVAPPPVQVPTPPAQAPPTTQPPSPSPSRAVAPAQPPSPPALSLPTTEVPPSPSRVATPSRVPAKVPASPSRRGIQSRVSSPAPASPSRAAPPSQTALQQASPSRLAPQARVASQPPSPSHAAPQPQQPSESTPLPTSEPAEVSQQSRKEDSPPTAPHQTPPLVEPTKSPPSPPRTKTDTKEISEPLPEESIKLETIQPTSPKTQPKAAEMPETISGSEEQSQVMQPDLVTTQPSQVSGDIKVKPDEQTSAAPTKISSQESDSGMDLKPDLESQRKSEEAKVTKTVEQEIIEERSKYDLADGKPEQKADTELSSKQVYAIKETGQLSDEGTLDKKEVLSTTWTSRKPAETAISPHPKVTAPLQKPAMSNGEKAALHKEIKEDVSKLAHKLGVRRPNQALDEKPFSIITLAGENRGATMHLGSDPEKRARTIHIHRGYKTNPDESTESTTDAEGASNDGKSGDQKAEEDMATKAYINSNAQGINNALVLNCSVAERNPGVQFSFSRSLIDHEKLKKDTGTSVTRKAEFNLTPAEKLTYAPTVRRRCLRGLFLESSDSDSDNPDRPRRHGCRYGCKEKGKDNIDIV
ncbi:hypothetical protein Ancab_025822 [Ancistrocladus abbreviatus]